jgi:hypothetical protein
VHISVLLTRRTRMPAPDKVRSCLHIYCGRWPYCEFTTRAEWAGMRHEHDTGHTMDWPGDRIPREIPRKEQNDA